MKRLDDYTILRWAAISVLGSLVLMVWGVLDTRPLSLVLAMSLGQLLGTAAFGVYVVVVLRDLRRARVLRDAPPPPTATPSDAPPPDAG